MAQEARKKDRPVDDPEAPWRLLGLAIRAGKAVSGMEAAENALRKRKARLILVAADSSASTISKFVPPGRSPAVPVLVCGDKATLGHWTGHDERAVVAILDQGFADKLRERIEAAGTA